MNKFFAISTVIIAVVYNVLALFVLAILEDMLHISAIVTAFFVLDLLIIVMVNFMLCDE